MTLKGQMRRLVALAVLAAQAGCIKWIAQDVPRPPARMHMVRGVARVRLLDAREYHLANVVIATDSLFGLTADEARMRVAVPLANVASIEQRRRDVLLTMLAGVLIVAFVVATGFFGS
jgi:hypothetical protein